MKYILVLCLIFLSGTISAEDIEIYIENPGLGGMQSNYGINMMSNNQLYYAHNVNTWETPGEIKRRYGLENYGSDSTLLYGAAGHYSGKYGYSMMIGVKADTTDPFRGVFCYSDTSGSSFDREILTSRIYPYKDRYHDWTQFDDFSIHADGRNIPFIFVGESNFKERQASRDRTIYSPKILSMGPEAPGQPRVSVYNDSTTNMRGVFVYAFSFGGDMGLPSAPIKVHNQAVAISHFPFMETDITNATASDTLLLVLRRSIIPEEYNRGEDVSSGWYAIDSIIADSIPNYYIDTLPRIEEGGQWGWDTVWYYMDTDPDPDTVIAITSCDTCNNMLTWGQYQGRDYILTDELDWYVLGEGFTFDSTTGDYRVWESCNEDSSFSTTEWEGLQEDGGVVGFYASYCTYPNGYTRVTSKADTGASGDSTFWWTDGTDSKTCFTLDRRGKNPFYQWTHEGLLGEVFYFDSAVVNYRFEDRCGTTYTASEWIIDYIGWDTTHNDDCGWVSGGWNYPRCVDSLIPLWDSVDYDHISDLWYDWTDTGGYRPGQGLNVNPDTALNIYCKVAYSYYDPVTRAESPMSPPVTMRYDSATMGILDTLYIPNNESQGFSWIRIYQTMVDNSIAGAKDTSVWYGTLQVRLASMLDTAATGASKNRNLIMRWADTAVANGLDSADVTGTADYPYNFIRTVLGQILIRPPYVYDNQVQFSDMDYISNRMVGIGDPIEPERLYISEPNTNYTNVFNWHPFEYLDINEGVSGALVFIERAEGFGRDALLVGKRNALYIANIGEGSSVQLLESNVGAVSRRATVKYGKTIYFLSPNMKIYATHGTTVQSISDPVQNYVDSLFTDGATAAKSCRAFRFGETIKFFDTTSGVGLSFHTERGTWSLETYSNDSSYVPVGSFTYDSSTAGIMAGFPETILYSKDSDPMKVQGSTVDDWGVYTRPVYEFQLPFLGDGKSLWSIQKLQMTLENRSTYSFLRYYVINEMHEVILHGVDSLTASADGNWELHFPYNIGKYLSVKFHFQVNDMWGDGLARNDVLFRDFRFYMRDMGADDVH